MTLINLSFQKWIRFAICLYLLSWTYCDLHAKDQTQNWTQPQTTTHSQLPSDAIHLAVRSILSPKPASNPSKTEWRIFIDPLGQIFPSLILATSKVLETPAAARNDHPENKQTQKRFDPDKKHFANSSDNPIQILGDKNGLIGIRFTSPKTFNSKKSLHLWVELEPNSIVSKTSFETDITLTNQRYEVLPFVQFQLNALERIQQFAPINFVFRVKLDNEDLGQKSFTARIHPINDCIFYYQNPHDAQAIQDLVWLYAAYVNENAPVVTDLIHSALQNHIVHQFDGYKSHHVGQVLLQVYALWDCLHRKGISYADISTTSAESEVIGSQYIQLLDESLQDQLANCVDGTVLFASLLQAIGIHAYLIRAPGHMYLGFDINESGSAQMFLETTMLGNTKNELGKYTFNKSLVKEAPPFVTSLTSWYSFNAALDFGTKQYMKNKRIYDQDKRWDFQAVSIQWARKAGIQPIIKAN